MQQINENILIFMNSLMDYSFVKFLAVTFADSPIFFLPIFLVFMWIFYTYKQKNNERKKNLLFIFYSCVIWYIISNTIKLFVDIDRPEEALKWIWQLVLDHIPDTSFPSDHTTVWIAFLVALFLAGYKKTGYVFLVPAILMVISRVVVWVHWPFDILAWTIIWIVWAFISFKILKKQDFMNKINNFIIKMTSYIKL